MIVVNQFRHRHLPTPLDTTPDVSTCQPEMTGDQRSTINDQPDQHIYIYQMYTKYRKLRKKRKEW